MLFRICLEGLYFKVEAANLLATACMFCWQVQFYMFSRFWIIKIVRPDRKSLIVVRPNEMPGSLNFISK